MGQQKVEQGSECEPGRSAEPLWRVWEDVPADLRPFLRAVWDLAAQRVADAKQRQTFLAPNTGAGTARGSRTAGGGQRLSG